MGKPDRRAVAVKLDTQIHLHPTKTYLSAPRLIFKLDQILYWNEYMYIYIHSLGNVMHDYGWVGVVDDIDNVVARLANTN